MAFPSILLIQAHHKKLRSILISSKDRKAVPITLHEFIVWSYTNSNLVPGLFRQQAGRKLGLRHFGLLYQLSSLQCCRQRCEQAKEYSLPQSTYNPENIIPNSSIRSNNTQFVPFTFWLWLSSSLLVLSQKRIWGRGRCLMTTREKETLQPPLHSVLLLLAMYSLLSHNGSNMPKASLNRKKMEAQVVIRTRNIVQCRIISSRAQQLSFDLSLYQVILGLD